MNRGVKAIFWGAEIVFALISSNSEAVIYQAYSSGDWSGTVQAFARAGGMQLMIVMFGFAAVQASKHSRNGMVWLANTLALAFSFISFWFIRESALADAHLDFLATVYHSPILLPTFWGTIIIGGKDLDASLIGCLPFLQVAVNWFAPIITSDTKKEYAETIDEMKDRQKRELLEAQFKADKRAITAGGLGKAARGAMLSVRGKQEEPSDADQPLAPAIVEHDQSSADQAQIPVASNGHAGLSPVPATLVDEQDDLTVSSAIAMNFGSAADTGVHLAPAECEGITQPSQADQTASLTPLAQAERRPALPPEDDPPPRRTKTPARTKVSKAATTVAD